MPTSKACVLALSASGSNALSLRTYVRVTMITPCRSSMAGAWFYASVPGMVDVHGQGGGGNTVAAVIERVHGCFAERFQRPEPHRRALEYSWDCCSGGAQEWLATSRAGLGASPRLGVPRPLSTYRQDADLAPGDQVSDAIEDG